MAAQGSDLGAFPPASSSTPLRTLAVNALPVGKDRADFMDFLRANHDQGFERMIFHYDDRILVVYKTPEQARVALENITSTTTIVVRYAEEDYIWMEQPPITILSNPVLYIPPTGTALSPQEIEKILRCYRGFETFGILDTDELRDKRSHGGGGESKREKPKPVLKKYFAIFRDVFCAEDAVEDLLSHTNVPATFAHSHERVRVLLDEKGRQAARRGSGSRTGGAAAPGAAGASAASFAAASGTGTPVRPPTAAAVVTSHRPEASKLSWFTLSAIPGDVSFAKLRSHSSRMRGFVAVAFRPEGLAVGFDTEAHARAAGDHFLNNTTMRVAQTPAHVVAAMKQLPSGAVGPRGDVLKLVLPEWFEPHRVPEILQNYAGIQDLNADGGLDNLLVKFADAESAANAKRDLEETTNVIVGFAGDSTVGLNTEPAAAPSLSSASSPVRPATAGSAARPESALDYYQLSSQPEQDQSAAAPGVDTYDLPKGTLQSSFAIEKPPSDSAVFISAADLAHVKFSLRHSIGSLDGFQRIAFQEEGFYAWFDTRDQAARAVGRIEGEKHVTLTLIKKSQPRTRPPPIRPPTSEQHAGALFVRNPYSLNIDGLQAILESYPGYMTCRHLRDSIIVDYVNATYAAKAVADLREATNIRVEYSNRSAQPGNRYVVDNGVGGGNNNISSAAKNSFSNADDMYMADDRDTTTKYEYASGRPGTRYAVDERGGGRAIFTEPRGSSSSYSSSRRGGGGGDRGGSEYGGDRDREPRYGEPKKRSRGTRGSGRGGGGGGNDRGDDRDRSERGGLRSEYDRGSRSEYDRGSRSEYDRAPKPDYDRGGRTSEFDRAGSGRDYAARSDSRSSKLDYPDTRSDFSRHREPAIMTEPVGIDYGFGAADFGFGPVGSKPTSDLTSRLDFSGGKTSQQQSSSNIFGRPEAASPVRGLSFSDLDYGTTPLSVRPDSAGSRFPFASKFETPSRFAPTPSPMPSPEKTHAPAPLAQALSFGAFTPTPPLAPPEPVLMFDELEPPKPEWATKFVAPFTHKTHLQTPLPPAVPAPPVAAVATSPVPSAASAAPASAQIAIADPTALEPIVVTIPQTTEPHRWELPQIPVTAPVPGATADTTPTPPARFIVDDSDTFSEARVAEWQAAHAVAQAPQTIDADAPVANPMGTRTLVVTCLGSDTDKADVRAVLAAQPGFEHVRFGIDSFRAIFIDAGHAAEVVTTFRRDAGPSAAGWKAVFAKKEMEGFMQTIPGEPTSAIMTNTTHWSETELTKLMSSYEGFERLEYNQLRSRIEFRDTECAERALTDLNATTDLVSVYPTRKTHMRVANPIVLAKRSTFVSPPGQPLRPAPAPVEGWDAYVAKLEASNEAINTGGGNSLAASAEATVATATQWAPPAVPLPQDASQWNSIEPMVISDNSAWNATRARTEKKKGIVPTGWPVHTGVAPWEVSQPFGSLEEEMSRIRGRTLMPVASTQPRAPLQSAPIPGWTVSRPQTSSAAPASTAAAPSPESVEPDPTSATAEPSPVSDSTPAAAEAATSAERKDREASIDSDSEAQSQAADEKAVGKRQIVDRHSSVATMVDGGGSSSIDLLDPANEANAAAILRDQVAKAEAELARVFDLLSKMNAAGAGAGGAGGAVAGPKMMPGDADGVAAAAAVAEGPLAERLRRMASVAGTLKADGVGFAG
ncbi:hypothetical protein HDU87_007696 [Geranomyces variabilis]|uniref:Uncharacterized protein n=1 Tax=Geranomyces variabilis TaxID=109894 RepID=A0AAD5TEZ0_9FUNG|nr:hypothetical protein HDU87_007696 [Geranomyces variabilis]